MSEICKELSNIIFYVAIGIIISHGILGFIIASAFIYHNNLFTEITSILYVISNVVVGIMLTAAWFKKKKDIKSGRLDIETANGYWKIMIVLSIILQIIVGLTLYAIANYVSTLPV